jgi:hypothetical protein
MPPSVDYDIDLRSSSPIGGSSNTPAPHDKFSDMTLEEALRHAVNNAMDRVVSTSRI